MKFLTSAAFVFTAIALASSASAMPVGHLSADSGLATKVAGGCGPGWRPTNRWGECVPKRYGPPPPPDYGGRPPPPGYYGGEPPPPGYGGGPPPPGYYGGGPPPSGYGGGPSPPR